MVKRKTMALGLLLVMGTMVPGSVRASNENNSAAYNAVEDQIVVATNIPTLLNVINSPEYKALSVTEKQLLVQEINQRVRYLFARAI